MKIFLRLLLAATVLSSFSGCERKFDPNDTEDLQRMLSEAVDEETIQRRGDDNIVYQKNSQTPFSGWLKDMHPNGQVRGAYSFRDGKYDGFSLQWYENGQKEIEATRKAGKLEGKRTIWHKNGQKALEATFKNGKADGLFTQWYENGKKEKEANYKNGEEVETTSWREDGTEVPD
jgi:antitoxin component YwqK of YwqJK toxin-antitoxin module